MKPDRQARVLLAELADGSVEGALVLDLGGRQSAFHLRGPEMAAYLAECADFYNGCDYLMWSDLHRVLGSAASATPPIHRRQRT